MTHNPLLSRSDRSVHELIPPRSFSLSALTLASHPDVSRKLPLGTSGKSTMHRRKAWQTHARGNELFYARRKVASSSPYLQARGPRHRPEMAGAAETHPVPGSAAPAPIRDARQPGTGATWTSLPRPHVDPRPALPPPRPAGKPYPRGRPRRLGGGGGRQVLPGKSSPPTPHVLRKRNYGAKLVALPSASLESSLSLRLQARAPAAPARATFPTPDAVPRASPAIAAGFLPLLA